MRYKALGISGLASAVSLLAWPASPARACSSIELPCHELEDPDDVSPPGQVVVEEVMVGRGERNPAMGCQSSSCGTGGGYVSLILEAPADDRTPAEKMGYRLELVAGDPPGSNFSLFHCDVRALGTEIFIGWFDGESDEQEPIDFTLGIRAVDLGGNVGPPIEVRVRHPGSGGCSVSQGGFSALTPWVALPVLFLGWRLRRARHG